MKQSAQLFIKRYKICACFKKGDINKQHLGNYTGIQFYAKRVIDKYLTSCES